MHACEQHGSVALENDTYVIKFSYIFKTFIYLLSIYVGTIRPEMKASFSGIHIISPY
jgi:hypothetical protein